MEDNEIYSVNSKIHIFPTLLNMQNENEFYNLYHVKGTSDRILFFLKGI